MVNLKCTFCNNDNCGRITDLTIDGVSSHIGGLDAIEAEYFLRGIEWYLDLIDVEHIIKFVSEPCNEMCGDDENDEYNEFNH